MSNKKLDEIYRKGDAADAMLKDGRAQEAIKAYETILAELQKQNVVDSYLNAKLALGCLRAYIKLGDFKSAYGIWNAGLEDSPFGLGIYALESAQTTVHDMLTYDMICAFLHTLADSDKGEAAAAVNQYLSRVCEQALEEGNRGLMKLALSNWKQHLRDIFRGSIPLEYAKPLIKFEKELGESVKPQAVTFPPPVAWQKPEGFREMSYVLDNMPSSEGAGRQAKQKKRSAS